MITVAVLSMVLSPLWAQTPQAADQSISQLYDGFISATDGKDQIQALNQISQTKPVSAKDVSDLFDLFARYPQSVQNAAVTAINRISPSDYAFAPLLLNYLTQPDPKTRFFAILAELRLRDPEALPIIKGIAKPEFTLKAAENSPYEAKQDTWWTQYEALDALATWEGASALSLVKKQALLAPAVSRIITAHFWVQAMPALVRWANSSNENMKDAAHEGLSAPAPFSDLSQTRSAMLDLVLDAKQPEDVRHYLAIKIGLCSNHDQVASLIQRRKNETDAQTKLYLLSAIFASLDPQAIPLLQDEAKTNPNPDERRGALAELNNIMTPADYHAFALGVSTSDADVSVRDFAQSSLSISSAATSQPAPAIVPSSRPLVPSAPAAPQPSLKPAAQ